MSFLNFSRFTRGAKFFVAHNGLVDRDSCEHMRSSFSQKEGFRGRGGIVSLRIRVYPLPNFRGMNAPIGDLVSVGSGGRMVFGEGPVKGDERDWAVKAGS